MSAAASSPSVFMPFAATEVAGEVDRLYGFLVIASLISFVLVIGGLILFAIKYRRRSENDKTPYIHHNTTLEFLWSFIPFLIFMFVFVWGWKVYFNLRGVSATDTLEILVEGQKWDWTFTYKNGRRVPGELRVPVNQPVKLVMTSKDVIHSFFVPAFRNKQDVVPGMYTTFFFKARNEGTYQIFCTEYCGDGHSAMGAKLKVVSREEFDEWMTVDPYKGLSLADIGQKIFQSRCVACHTNTEAKNVGPGFKGLFGANRQFDDGSTITADENYIRESILNPAARVVAGYPKGLMPTFAGQLSEQEMMGIIEYIKSLK